jgi:hypothetical protein
VGVGDAVGDGNGGGPTVDPELVHAAIAARPRRPAAIRNAWMWRRFTAPSQSRDAREPARPDLFSTINARGGRAP